LLYPFSLFLLCFFFWGVFVFHFGEAFGCPFGEFEALGVFWHCIIELVGKGEVFFGGGGFGWGLRRP